MNKDISKSKKEKSIFKQAIQLDPNNPDNQIYYSHIGAIIIMNQETRSYESYSTGTLVGKGVVLTSYSAISYCITYKKFDQNLICFELRRKLKNKVAKVVKVEYSKKFDWALLYLQEYLIENPRFTLITHNINTEISHLVGKSYFYQFVGFPRRRGQLDPKITEELLIRSQGRVFIDQQYSSKLEYLIWAAHDLGTPLIIYPTSDYGQKAYILCIHTEGFDEAMTFRKQDAHYMQEKYDYGSKIIRDILLKNYPQYLSKKSIIGPLLQYQIQTVHQNSYQFSTYFYETNKNLLMSNYYEYKNIEDEKIQLQLFQDFKRFAECGIILQDINPESYFFYQQEGMSVQDSQLAHRMFNPRISLLQSKIKQQKRISIDNISQQDFYKHHLSKQNLSSIYKNTLNNLQQLFKNTVLEHYKQRQINQILTNYHSQIQFSNIQYRRPVIISCLSANQWSKQNLQKAINDFESITNNYKGQILNGFYSQFQKNRSILIETVDRIHRIIQNNIENSYAQVREKISKQAEKIVQPSIEVQSQSPKNISIQCRISSIIEAQILTQQKIEVQEYLPEQELYNLWNIKTIQDMQIYLRGKKLIQKSQLRFIKKFNPSSFKANFEEKGFRNFMGRYYHNLYHLYNADRIKLESNTFQVKTFQYIQDILKLLILKITDNIRIITYRFLQQVVPVNQKLLKINKDKWDSIKFPNLDGQLSLQTYQDQLYMRAKRLKQVEKIQKLFNKEILISNIMDLQDVHKRYLFKYEQDFKHLKAIQHKIDYSLQQYSGSQKIDENNMISQLLRIYQFPQQRSSLNVSKIILEEISLFSLLNSDMEGQKLNQINRFCQVGKIFFRQWDWIIKNNKKYPQKQQEQLFTNQRANLTHEIIRVNTIPNRQEQEYVHPLHLNTTIDR